MDEGRGGLGLADSGSFQKPSSTEQISNYPAEGDNSTRPIPDTDHPGVSQLPHQSHGVSHEFSEAPTQSLAAHQGSDLRSGRTASNAPLAPLAPLARAWTRISARFTGQSRRRRAIALSLIALLALALPAIAALTTALDDYQTLKALGLDGVARLTAVRTDLLGSSSSGGTSASLGGGGGSSLGSSTLAQLQAALTLPGPGVVNPAYTYLAQRQGGVSYPLQVTVNPAKGVSAEGDKPITWKTTLNADTYLTLGGAPKPATPTPTPTSAPSPTPTVTPAGGSTGSGAKTSSKIPDPAHLAHARQDLLKARDDFATLDSRLAHPDWALSLATVLPVGATDLAAVRALAQVGVDATEAGLTLLDAATPLLTRLHNTPSLLSSPQPLISQADIIALQSGLTGASAKVDDIVAKLKTVNINALPLSAKQKALLTQVMPLLPKIKTLADQAVPLLGVFGWVIGADATRHFLIQTLDRGELRATGGFTGQYAVLTLNGGKLGPLSLQDVNCLDYLTGCLSNGWIFGRRPPAPYNSWWPFANWGLRDSNLSADFPTDAQLVMSVYQHESGQKVDGLIDISPLAIEDVLRVTGPITVDLYHETITADNLETKLHYYQQDPTAIALEKKLSGGGRKSFTQLVGQLLQQRVKALPLSQMLPLALQMVGDLRNKNLQVYLTDPAAEALLTQYAINGGVDTASAVDGFLLVQSNVSVSKASNFVNVTERDDVTLDAQGGATHHLTLTFHGNYTYNQVYGYLTYRDYLRIYVPPQSRLISGDGFDSGKAMCWPASELTKPTPTPTTPPTGPTPTPPPNPTPIPTPTTPTPPAPYTSLSICGANPYPHGEMVCPSGDYSPGTRAPDVYGSTGYNPWPVDQPGGPTNTTSDLANRAMFAGYIFVPDGCTATVTLSWYTSGVAPKA